MNGKLRVLGCAALGFALAAAPANASVSINGKTLDKIDDIVLETTGSRVVRKESFLKVLKASDGKFRFYAVRGEGTGSGVTLPESGAQYLNADGGHTNTGVHPALGTKRNSDGSLVVMVPAATDSGVTANFYRVSLDANSNVTQTQIKSVNVTSGSNLYVTDASGGLFPYGGDGDEVFVIAYFSADGGKRPGFKQSFTSYVAFVDAKGSVKTQRVGTMNGCFPSIRVAAGDFDQDGWAREIAVMRDGSGHDYYMQACRINSSLGWEDFYHTSLGTRDDDADNIDGCDVVAGDFNGDGKTDLAAIYADKIKYDGYPAVTTFKWNGSGFGTQYRADEDEDLRMGSTYWTRSSFVPHFGIIAEAGDLDGDGRDELVFLTPEYMTGDKSIGEGGSVIVSVWGMDNNLSPSRKFWRYSYVSIDGYGGVSGTDMAECSYLPRSISLALVPVGDKLSDGAFTRRVFISKSQGDDSVQKASDYKAGDYVGYLTPQISGGSITGLADIVRHSGGGAGRAMGLLPGDFYCQTVELGEPDHMVFEAERSYAAEIQVPPYHVDYVQVPFEVNRVKPTAPSVLNMSYMGSSVAYSKSSTDSKKQDVAFKTASTLDWGVSANATVPLIGTTVSGGYKDTATSVENAASSSEAKTTLTLTDATDAADVAVLYKTDRHVWRYPVVSAVPGRPEGKDAAFMTFSLCDTPATVHGAIGQSGQFDDYNPIHEEGNLFSYPTKIENIPCYADRQYELTAVQEKTTGGNTTIDLAVSESHADTNGTTTTSKKVANGSVSVSIPIPKVANIGVSGTASYANELTDTTTFTKSYLSSEKFTVSLKNGALGFGSEKVAHNVKTQLYTDAAGVMKVGFAVDLKATAGDTAEVWQAGGMYDGKPDPALVLPAKYTRFVSVIDNVTRTVWSANTNRKSAIQLRGIWFRDEAGNVTSSALVRGKKYRIEVPVYNASFRAPDRDVEIAMQLRTLGVTASDDKVVIGNAGSGTFSIGGWTKDTEANKATVAFDWTVPSNLEKGNYSLYFVIDPNNVIDELHEDWDVGRDPGGNNVGCYPVAILDAEPAAYTMAETVSVASISESDFKMLFHPVMDGDSREWLTLAEFREELAGMDEDFRAYAKIVYSGSDTLTNMYLDVVRVDPDGTENRIATRVIPALFPNTEYDVSFMVSPEKASAGTFGASLSGGGANLHWGRAGLDGSGGGEGESSGSGGGSSGSGGCDAGLGFLTFLLMPFAFAKRR